MPHTENIIQREAGGEEPPVACESQGQPKLEVISRKDALALGLKRFFTGKPCVLGHVAERFVSSRGCVKCTRQYHTQNKDLIAEQKRNYYMQNKDALCEKKRQYRTQSKDLISEQRRKYRKQNKTAIAEYQRQYRTQNKDAICEKARQYRAENPEVRRAASHRRRARKLAASGTHTAQDIKNLLTLQKGKCACCKEKLDKYHVDHVVPLAAGGSNDKHNLQILCPTCNLSKSAKHPVEFMQQRGFLL